MQNIYMSLDEAREEIKKRWNDVELRKKIDHWAPAQGEPYEFIELEC